ncbi:MAG: glycosyltransferase family 4 protein [Actinomycetota bacterium]|nr:glycosyltransferase family 4 protein [Actinomycetota bacterium]
MGAEQSRERKRLLLVNQYFPPDASATAHLLGEIAGDLAELHEVWVVAGRPSYNPSAGPPPPAGIHVVRVRSTGFPRSSMAGRLVNYVSFFVGAAVNAFRVPRPDVVLTFTDPPVIGLLGAAVAALSRRPFVYVCWDIFPDVAVALGRLDRPVLVTAWRLANRVIRSRADRVVAVGRDMRAKLEEEGVERKKIVVIPHWADATLPPGAEVEAARRDQGWEGSFVVMHAGNVGLAQNLDSLIAASDRLRDDPRIRVVIVGDGATRDRLMRDARARGLSNVQFLPYRPKKEALATLAAADLHVVSLARGLKGSVVASKVYGVLALGKPFVAAVEDGSEIALLIGETGAGVRAEPSDAEALDRHIRDFADGVLDRNELGARGRREFERRYRREHGTRLYRQAVQDLLDGN